jgi:hypothetical protein
MWAMLGWCKRLETSGRGQAQSGSILDRSKVLKVRKVLPVRKVLKVPPVLKASSVLKVLKVRKVLPVLVYRLAEWKDKFSLSSATMTLRRLGSILLPKRRQTVSMSLVPATR